MFPIVWVVDKATDELLYQICATVHCEMPDDKYLVADPADRVSLKVQPNSEEA